MFNFLSKVCVSSNHKSPNLIKVHIYIFLYDIHHVTQTISADYMMYIIFMTPYIDRSFRINVVNNSKSANT